MEEPPVVDLMATAWAEIDYPDNKKFKRFPKGQWLTMASRNLILLNGFKVDLSGNKKSSSFAVKKARQGLSHVGIFERGTRLQDIIILLLLLGPCFKLSTFYYQSSSFASNSDFMIGL